MSTPPPLLLAKMTSAKYQSGPSAEEIAKMTSVKSQCAECDGLSFEACRDEPKKQGCHACGKCLEDKIKGQKYEPNPPPRRCVGHPSFVPPSPPFRPTVSTASGVGRGVARVHRHPAARCESHQRASLRSVSTAFFLESTPSTGPTIRSSVRPGRSVSPRSCENERASPPRPNRAPTVL